MLAVVRATVATLWSSPEAVRAVDAPALGRFADIPRWVSAMDTDQPAGDRVLSQLLLGERVLVEEIRPDGWARVVAIEQPAAKLDPRGYPGWLPATQLAPAPPTPPAAGLAPAPPMPAAQLTPAPPTAAAQLAPAAPMPAAQLAPAPPTAAQLAPAPPVPGAKLTPAPPMPAAELAPGPPMPAAQLAPAAPMPAAAGGDGAALVVDAITTALRDGPDGRVVLPGVVLGTRLSPAGDAERGWLPVHTPGHDRPLWAPERDLAPIPTRRPTAAQALAIAQLLRDVAYVWGGVSPYGIDCSGLVHLAWRRLGVPLPRDADDQARATTPLTLGEERPGDLYLFARPGRAVHHIGFVSAYPGARRHMLHACYTQRRVVDEPLPRDRTNTLIAVHRVPPPP